MPQRQGSLFLKRGEQMTPTITYGAHCTVARSEQSSRVLTYQLFEYPSSLAVAFGPPSCRGCRRALISRSVHARFFF